MKTNWRAIIAGATLMAISAPVSTHAADLFGGGMKDSYMPPPMVSSSSSWYFRVDGAYGGYDTPIMVEDGLTTLTDAKIENGWGLSGGVGRYFTSSLRGDVTVDHRFDTDASGRLGDPNLTLPGTRNFGLKSTAVLFNLYYDFDMRSRFTPYIGVGLGVVRHTTLEGVVDGECGCTGIVEGAKKTDVAAALMAGVSVALLGGRHVTSGGSIKDIPMVQESRNLYLDVGYRFLYLGDATTGPVRGTNGTNFNSNDPSVEGIHAHEVRVGLRYDFR